MAIWRGAYLAQKWHLFSQCRTLLPKFLYMATCVSLANRLENKIKCVNRLTWHDVFIQCLKEQS
jgi:hypothetical protein